MKKHVIALSMVLLSSGALAQTYVGFAGGFSKQDVDCGGASSCSTNDFGFKLYAGYKVTPMFAGELTYTDFGKVDASANGISAHWSTTAVSIGGAVFVPFSPKLTGIARLGLSSAEAKISASNGFISRSDSETNTEPYLGFGLGYSLNKSLALNGHLDFSRSEYNGSKADTMLLAVGLSYAF